jgi:hypothetical protein
MPVYLDLANLIFDKKLLHQKYRGGCTQFRIDWDTMNSEVNQEDDELISLVKMNIDEFEIEKLVERGLTFNSELQCSNDFGAISRYGGAHWETDWLESNEIFPWHSDCSPKHKELAIKVEGITMDKVMEIWDNEGIYVLETIKTNTNKA